MAALKYSSKPVYWDRQRLCVISKEKANSYRTKKTPRLPDYITKFDSTLEFKVYLELVRMYGQENIVCQHPIQIIPPGYCYPKGKVWKIDFAVFNTSKPYGFQYFVEAKGKVLPEFRTSLACLEQRNLDVFNKVCLVFDRTVPMSDFLVTALYKSHRRDSLLTLSQLEKLPRLP
jgi:hypothetical protein